MKQKKVDITPNKLTNEQKSSLIVRIISSIVAVAIALPCFIIGNIPFIVFMVFLACFAGYEIVHCAKKRYNPMLYIVTILIVLGFTFYPFLKSVLSGGTDFSNYSPYLSFNSIFISASLTMLAICLLFLLVTIDKNFEVRDACYMFTFGVLCGLALQCAMYLRFFPQYELFKVLGYEKNAVNEFGRSTLLIIYVVAGSLLCDSGAYFVGMLFGKNKINERISPKKTWEGAIGGTIVSFVFTFLFALIFALNDVPLISLFSKDKWYFILIVSILVPLVSQLGDFTFSSVKRYYGVKDFGYIMPGHGGVLDRIDSVMFAAIVSTILIIMFSAISSGNFGGIFF